MKKPVSRNGGREREPARDCEVGHAPALDDALHRDVVGLEAARHRRAVRQVFLEQEGLGFLSRQLVPELAESVDTGHQERVPAAGRSTGLQDRRIVDRPTHPLHRLTVGALGNVRGARGGEPGRAKRLALVQLVLEGTSGFDVVKAHAESPGDRRYPLHPGVVKGHQTIGSVSAQGLRGPLRAVFEGVDYRSELSQDRPDRDHRRILPVDEPHEVAPASSALDDLHHVKRAVPVDHRQARPGVGSSSGGLHSRDTLAGHEPITRRGWLRPIRDTR